MKSVQANGYPPRRWEKISLPVQPHRAEPITLIEAEESPYPRLDAPTDDLDAFRKSQVQFVLEPVHPHIEHLQPADVTGFMGFAQQLGLAELMAWLVDRCGGRLPNAWNPVVGAHDALRYRQLWTAELGDAWTDPETVNRYRADRGLLLDAKDLISGVTGVTERREIIFFAAEAVEGLVYDTVHDAALGSLCLKPRHLFARAWHELYTLPAEGRICQECANAFIPSHGNQHFCRQICRIDSTNRGRQQDPWVKESDRMRKRKARGSITEQEYDEWLQQNPRPKKRRP